MSTFWAFEEAPVAVGECVLSPDESRHLAARRLRPGDPLVVFDGAGATGKARLIEATKRAARVEVESVEHTPATSEGPLIASAVPKGDRLSTMLQMLSQLGARVWQPLVLEHSVVRSVDPAAPRLRRILVESAKVARRPWLLEVRAPLGLDALLGAPRSGSARFGDREGETGGLPTDCGLVVIGPEAGFSDAERADLASADVLPVAFAPYNLRVETAAIAATVSAFGGRAGRTGGNT